ncbi:hypothetical protein GCM10027299_12710 [Larkinella ripae]
MKTSLLFCKTSWGLLGFLLLSSLAGYGQTIYYVTQDGGAVIQNGSSWATAYDKNQLQTAIDAASAYSLGNGNAEVQVWVGTGSYKPTTSSNRSLSFSLKNNVVIYGGFAGSESLLSDRPALSLSAPASSTLSGEIGAAGTADNSYHVVKNTDGQTTSAVLDGFVITAGNADGAGETDILGGGMLNQNSSPTLRNIRFSANQGNRGGAMHNVGAAGGSSNPVLLDCSFIGNAGHLGGAVYNFADFGSTCSPILTHCSFSQNTAETGGVLYNIIQAGGVCSPVVNRCEFTANSATANSGVIANEGGSPKVTNCSFVGNSATKGGVAFNYTVQTFTNCSFLGNTASESGGVSSQISGSTTFRNCIFWNNGGNQTLFNAGTATTTANYSLFEASVANYSGNGNLTTSTLPFVSDTDLQLTPCSPAINAGDPASTVVISGSTDLAGNPRFYNGGRIDMGAFEFQGETPTPPVISSGGETSLTVAQGSALTLTITGCSGGTISWQGTNSTSGDEPTIHAQTSAVGTVVYSATCTVGGCASAPGSATVTVVGAPVSGSFDGFVYGADCGSFRGWAWNRNKPNAVVSVEILDGSTVLTTLPAGDFRQDLLDNGKGNGHHAFHYPLPASLKDGAPHSLSARVKDSGFTLKNSPKALVCQNSPEPPVGNKAPVAPSPTVLIAPLVAQENVPFSGTLVAFTDPEGTPLTYALTGLPAGLSLDASTRVISGTPTEVGPFLLTYSATDVPGSTNSVSFNLTVNPAATSGVTGDFDGYLDKLDCGGIRGWVWDRKKPNTPLTVEFSAETSPGNYTVLGSTLANIYRQDLKDANKGNGAHAYNFSPSGLVSGTKIRARVLGSNFELKGSPKTYQCASARLSAETAPGLQVMVLGNPVSGPELAVEIRGAEGQPLRLQLTDVQGRTVSLRSLEKAEAVELHRFDLGSRHPGLLLLQVSTPSHQQTTRIVTNR